MKTQNILLLLAALIFYLIRIENLSAQYNFWNPDMTAIAKPSSIEGWVKFKNNSNIDPNLIFAIHKSAFGLSNDDQMVLYRINTDNLQYSHFRYRQTYKNIKVEGCEYIVHSLDGFAVKTNGKIVHDLNLSVNPTITESNALNIALSYVNATTYMWEDTTEEQLLKQIKNDNAATYFPQAELVITRLSDEMEMIPGNLILAYKVNIFSKVPYDRNFLYINANSGNIFKQVPLILNCIPGNVCTLYNGEQNLDTKFTGFGGGQDYTLFDDCRGNGIHTQKNIGLSFVDVFDDDNNWPDPTCTGDQIARAAASTHWAGQMTYDYFFNIHGRNSFDENGALMLQRNYGGCTNGASWNFTFTQFCWGTSPLATNWFNSLDVVGHEWGHALFQYEIGSTTGGTEAGALAESFGDIWGTMVEFYAQQLYEPSNPGDWLIAEDFWNPALDGYLRNLENPKLKPNQPGWEQADTYLGQYYSTGGAHIKGGVQNHWFYLLSEGSSATDEINDNNDVFSITGISKEKAAAIAYRNLTVYLPNSPLFDDARQGSISAAEDIFGLCSEEVAQTIEAWNAVGVYGTSPIPTFDFNNYTVSGTETWITDFIIEGTVTIPDGAELTIQGAYIQFGAIGFIDIKPGGKLNLINATLTGLDAPCLTMWNGVLVDGEFGLFPPIPFKIAELFMDNSVIEHANAGVEAWGTVTAINNSTFFNNKVNIIRGLFLINESSFTDCHFNFNPPLRDGSTDPVTFVKIENAAFIAPEFTNNSFINFASVIPTSQKPIAIDAVNSRFTAIGNNFNELLRGIWSINTFAGLESNLNIRFNSFNNVQSSIRIVGGRFDEIVGNTFTGIDLTGSVSSSTNFFSIFLNGTSGFIIRGNTINTATYGIFCINSASTAGEIHSNNTFINCWRDIDARGNNSNLQIRCNVFDGNHASAINVFGFPSAAALALFPDQGSCGTAQDPAGNEFINGNFHLFSYITPFTYHHHREASCPSNFQPKPDLSKTTSNITLVNCSYCETFQSCFDDPSIIIPEQVPLKALIAITKAFEKRIEKENEPNKKEILINRLMILYLKTNQRDKAIAYLEQHSSIAHKKILIGSYIRSGEFTKAAQLISIIPQNNLENQNFVKYHNVLLNLGINNKTIYQINGQQEQDVRDVAGSAGCVSANAQALLKIVFDEDAVLLFPDPDSLLNNNARIAATNELPNELTKENESAKLINIVPNPFNNETVIQYYVQETAHSAEIIVYDIVGKPVKSLTLNKGNSDIIINASYLDNGVYFLRMKVDGRIVANRKLVVMH